MLGGSVLMFSQAGFAAPKIASYDQKVLVAKDGAGEVTAVVEMKGLSEGTVAIPLLSGGIKDFRIEGLPPHCKATPVLKGDAPPHVLLAIAGAGPGTAKVTMSFGIQAAKKDPKSRKYELSHQFVNAGSAVIEKYRYTVCLPPGDAFHSVVSVEPKAKSGGGADVHFDKAKSLHAGILEYKSMKIGDRVGMRVLAEPEGKSPLWIVLGAIISGLYLFSFRDIVANVKSKSEQSKVAG